MIVFAARFRTKIAVQESHTAGVETKDLDAYGRGDKASLMSSFARNDKHCGSNEILQV